MPNPGLTIEYSIAPDIDKLADELIGLARVCAQSGITTDSVPMTEQLARSAKMAIEALVIVLALQEGRQ